MGSGRVKIRRILEWQIWSRWREINTQVFCEPGLVRQCPSNQQHHFAVWCFGHHATSWDVALVSPFTKYIKESMEEMFSSLICFYLFFLYISFGTFFGQGIAPASQRGVK